MLKKTLAILLVILTLFISSACTYFENTTSVSSDTESEVVESESPSSESESESEVITSELTEDTTNTLESNLISDEDAIELFEIGNRTSNAWREFDIWPDQNSDDYIMYKSPRRTEPEKYYPLSPESYVRLSAPDIRGNTEIYYGNHDWMQENLARIFTKSFIEKHFTYGDPSPLIYQDGIVYIYPSGGAGYYSGRHMNHTILERSENELAIMCEVYRYDFDIFDINYSEIDRLLYMKFVKDGDNWLIDEHYSDYPCPVPAQDPIPAEYDWAYKKYYEIMPYCEMWYYFEKPEEDTAFDESKIIGMFKCVGKHYNGEFYKQEPEITPQLSFYEDGSCRLLIGYNGEKLYINGEYTISGREIDIVFDYSGTPFYGNKSPEYSFYFKEDDLIEINSNFNDDIKRGYGFVKVDNISEISSKEPTKEIDIMEFINLDWNFEEDAEYPYLTKDEILAFDKHAEFVMPDPSTSNCDFDFNIRNTNCSLFGYNGVLEYFGSIQDQDKSENVTERNNPMYGTLYEYCGNGSDVLFYPKVQFTIPNVTYNQFLDIQNKISDFTNDDSAFRFSSYYEKYVSEELSEAVDALGADTVIGFPPVELDIIRSNIKSIPNSGWSITIEFLNDMTRQNNAQYWGKYVSDYYLPKPLYNILVITFET